MRVVTVHGTSPLLGRGAPSVLTFDERTLPADSCWGDLQQAVLARLGLPVSLPAACFAGATPILPEAYDSPLPVAAPLAVRLGGLAGLAGGKGGFAAILRAEARQDRGGTRDFGMCRDLQGRRLKAVNDEIRLRKWLSESEAAKRVRLGKEYEEPAGPAGIRGWYLAVPSWAEIRPQKGGSKEGGHGPRKTRVCVDWTRAREGGRTPPSGAPPWWGCPRGARCPFAHGEDDLRPEARLAALQARAAAEKAAAASALATYTAGVFLYDADEGASDMLATVKAGLAAAGEGEDSGRRSAVPVALMPVDVPPSACCARPGLVCLSGAAAGADAAPDLDAEAGWLQGGDVSALVEAEGLTHIMARGTGFATVAVGGLSLPSSSAQAAFAFEVTVGVGHANNNDTAGGGAAAASQAHSSNGSKGGLLASIPGYEDEEEDEEDEEEGKASGSAAASSSSEPGSIGVIQIGWLCEETAKLDPGAGEGVGDVAGSWGLDATRGVLRWSGQETRLPQPLPPLTAGDVIGALLVCGGAAPASAQFFVNGVAVCEALPLGSETSRLLPTVSLEGGEVVTLNTGVAAAAAVGGAGAEASSACFAFPLPPVTGSCNSSSSGSAAIPVLPVAAAAAGVAPAAAAALPEGCLPVTTYTLAPAAREKLGLSAQPQPRVPAAAAQSEEEEEAGAVEPPAKRRKVEEEEEAAKQEEQQQAPATEAAAPRPRPPPLDLSAVSSLEELWDAGYVLEDLRAECAARGLKAGGVWEEAASRLLAVKGLVASQVPKALQGKGFPGPAMPR